MQPPSPQFAIYARYSSDLQNPSSVDDQVALCRGLIADQLGGDADKALVFSDAAISGATMERPGILRLLAAVKAGRVNLVVAEGLDRLSRSLKDIAAVHETLSYHGATIWTAHEGRITELHVGLKGTMNALFLRDMKAKVKRGQAARVAAGFAPGSRAYGYRVIRGVVDAKGRNVNGVREINEAEAEVIRRIYREYAEGRKVLEIVAGLNRDGIPAPAGGLWKRNAIMGAAKKQEGVLRNEIYLGKVVANRHHVVRDPVTNRKRFVLNPETQWTRVDVPHLRIVTDEQWAAVRKLDRPRPGDALGAPTSPKPQVLKVHNQHALTGWVKCGWCGGSKSLANESRYLCSTHRYAKKCKNSRGTREPVLMNATFEALRSRVTDGADFRSSFIRAFAREAKRGEKLRKQATDLEARIGRLVTAIERGVDAEHTTQRVLALQNDLARLRHELQAEAMPTLPDEEMIRATLTRAIIDVEMSRDVERTRIMFERLLSEIVLTPIPDQPRGETVNITLREEGWPEFWRLITAG
jgi:DNA invertase Pin-like site-specific DNA recombinase